MNERLSLQDLIDLLAKKREITKKDAETFLRELVAVISENIENNESVKIKDFGTFKLVKVSPRKSVDVNTGEAIEIAAHYKLSFTPEKSLKEAINRPFAHFESVVLEEGVSFDDMENSEEEENTDTEVEVETKADNIAEITETEAGEPLAIFQAIEEIESDTKEQPVEETGKIDDEPVAEEAEEVNDTVVEQEEIIPDEKPEPEREPEEDKPEEQEETSEEILMELLSTDLLSKKDVAQDNIEDNEDSRRSRKRRRKFVTLGFFIFIIVAGFAVCAYFFQEIAQYLTDGPSDKDPKELVVNKEEVKQEAVLVTDSLTDANKTDSIKPVTPSQEEKVDINKPLGIATIKRGDTMRNIALEHYGHKSFWIYIYEENKDLIKNPNNVPLGTRLVIPAPAKYGIDANSKESIEMAKKAESKLIASLGL